MQPDDALKDAALDRELNRALDVDPSPEFVARVRTRIANEPARSPWRASWMFAVSAAAAVVVTAVVFQISNRSAVPTAPAVLTARALAPATGMLSTADSHVPPSHVVSAFRRTVNPYVASGVHGIPYVASGFSRTIPEILIDARESMALRALINGVRSGRVDLSPVVRASTPTAMELPPVTDLVIAPLAIEPLAPTGAEGVRQ